MPHRDITDKNIMKKKNHVNMPPTERLSLPERVAHAYYSHGLICSSHPIIILCFTVSIILLCSYPLINLPLPGVIPIQSVSGGLNSETVENATIFSGKPYAYIQQIVLKTGVSPWLSNMTVHDAFRAPLYQVFPLLETIRNFQIKNKSESISISNLCLHVESVKLKSSEDRRKILPEYNCLILSPANFWQQNEINFQMDNHLIGTIFNYHNIQKGKISLTEILCGLNVKESGLKRHPMRSRPRTLKYAITLVLERFDERYISGLRKKLESQYPLYVSSNDVYGNGNKTAKPSLETLHVYYPGEFNVYELFPLVAAYAILFFYIYFSLRKVELVKSKVGIAFGAVVTVISCLCMSLGLCFFFGLTISLNGKEIFPYLVAVVGLENILVITESVTNTPSHLDVKIRVAQGLSREGWSITKNLLIQVTILTIGFGTFVTAIQELCILGIVGLVCDFFLQLCFFTTVLSVDVRRRTESNFDNRNSYYYDSIPAHKVLSGNRGENASKQYLRCYGKEDGNLMRSKSHHNLTSCVLTSTPQSTAAYPANILACSAPILNKIPKRLRLVHIWASTRFFQRIFMVAMVGWMCFILYNGGFLQQVFQIDEIAKFHERLEDLNEVRPVAGGSAEEGDLKTLSAVDESSGHIKQDSEAEDGSEDTNRFRHREQDPHRRLSLYHWPVLMSLYNISLTGKSIAILPAIRLSHVVNPSTAVSMRNPNEKTEHFQWKTLAVALDPIDFSGSDDGSKISSLLTGSIDRPFVPRSPMEIALACILVIVSVFVLSYMTMVLYRCICSRNYAEWRSSWESNSSQENDTQVILEAVPTSLEGHEQEIECLATDGYIIASTCLEGDICVWNSADGELISNINRSLYRPYINVAAAAGVFTASEAFDPDLNYSDYESGSPPSRVEYDQNGFPCGNHRNRTRVSSNVDESRFVASEDSRVYNRKLFKGEFQLKPNLNFGDLRLTNSERDREDAKRGFDFGAQYKCLIGGGDDSDEPNNGRGEGKEDDQDADPRASPSAFALDVRNGGEGEGDASTNRKRSSLISWNGPTRSPCVGYWYTTRTEVPPIWCLDCVDNLIAVGCCNGRVEFWEAWTSKLKCVFEDGTNTGTTAVKIVGDKIVAARLNGSLDLLDMVSLGRKPQKGWGFSSARRTHVRTGSAGSAGDWEKLKEEVRCRRLGSVRAHQQPITVLDCENGRIVTGSQDHTLKVLRLDDLTLLYTLHGHCGPITCMFIDRMTPFLSGSGSQDGLLCVWDLLTGACMYSIQAHDGSVTALTYSASYVISLGTDERLCVWERFLGHLLNTIHMMHAYCSSMVMMTHNLLITSKHGSLVMWDVRCGDPIRIVRLGDSDHSVFVKQILNLGDSVVCDYGNQLRIVKFPIVTDKTE